jgi:uridine kinase
MKNVKIRCKNNKNILNVEIASKLSEIFPLCGVEMKYPPVAAIVNNVAVGMNYRVFSNKTVEFIDMTSASGYWIYTRTLFLVLCKAVHDLHPEGSVKIEFPVSRGYYCNINIGNPITPDDVADIRAKMSEIIAAAIPIHTHIEPSEEVIEMFRKMGDESKVRLLETVGSMYSMYCTIGDYVDSFYGPTLCNTGELGIFGLEMYYDGVLLRLPRQDNPEKLCEFIRQPKMFEVFNEFHELQDMLNIGTVGDLNKAIMSGYTNNITAVFEALQEKKLGRIADDICSRRTVRIVLIAGPSSSGKTTTCKRLSVQLMTNGIYPVGISMDDYYVNREETPLDENGDYDFESLYAVNLELFNEHLNALIRGEEIELPRYDFVTGKSMKSGKRLRLKNNEVLLIEGIHALNPELTSQIPKEQIYRVYASALTTITLDNHNYIPTTDNRLLRRMVRDYKYRGSSAQKTLERWASVRAGENKWIFPYQENADVMFNTAMLFELAVLKTQAEPLLEQVPENCPEHVEAKRLRQFLKYIKPMTEKQIPPTSLLREFLGGSSFEY